MDTLDALVQQAIGTLRHAGQHTQAATTLTLTRALDDIPWPGATDHYPAL